MTTIPQYVAKIAVAHNLDARLVCAVIEQESSWNQWAQRYEPAFYSKYIEPRIATILPQIEAPMRATSWGLMQIMGQTAREFGYRGIYLSQLCDPETGVEFGCRKLADCVLKAESLEAALQRWNGGGNPNYAAEVMARMSKYDTD